MNLLVFKNYDFPNNCLVDAVMLENVNFRRLYVRSIGNVNFGNNNFTTYSVNYEGKIYYVNSSTYFTLFSDPNIIKSNLITMF